MTKKLIAMVLTAVMLAGVLTGCGSIGTVQNTEPAAQNTQATEDNSNKSQITVATWDGGLGSKWLEDAAERFEELYKDKSFEEGKVGCDISIIASRSFDGSGMAFTPLTHDVYFVEGVDYYAMTNNKQMESVTDIISTPLSEYGEEETILNKIDPVMQEYLLAADGNYYAIPFYETFYNFSYDLDLWDAKSFYMAADGGWTNASGSLTAGPDGVQGTSDDGLPATFADFEKLLTRIKDAGVLPFVCAANATDYVANFLYEYYANYEGKEQMNLNYTFDGVATDLIQVDEDGNVKKLPDTQITFENGYELQQQAGRYYTLKFVENVLSKKDNFKIIDTHINAQKSFVRGGIANDQPIAMILEGSWWENEAKDAFNDLADNGLERHNYAVMPKPHATEEKIGQKATWLSQSGSYGFVASASDNKPLALEFLRFLHTNDELSHFTAEVNITRPLSYTVTAEDQSKMTTYGKSLLTLKKESDILYPYANELGALNNPQLFWSYGWAWLTDVNGYEYRNPWLYFMEVEDASSEAYFNGQKKYFEMRWDAVL